MGEANKKNNVYRMKVPNLDKTILNELRGDLLSLRNSKDREDKLVIALSIANKLNPSKKNKNIIQISEDILNLSFNVCIGFVHSKLDFERLTVKYMNEQVDILIKRIDEYDVN